MNNKKSLTRQTAAGRNNQVREGAARILFLAAACVSIIAVLLITVFLLVSGVPAIGKIGVFKFLFGTVWKPEGADKTAAFDADSDGDADASAPALSKA